MLAGIFDGEGCFQYGNGPTVCITNTFPYALRKIQETFGGTIRERMGKGSSRTYFQWRIHGEDAMLLIKSVREHLWEKLPQADLIIRIRDTKPGPRRDGLLEQLKKLKKLDYKGGIR